MSENYIVINGKRTELTDEQLKTLGIEIKKDPFARQGRREEYYYVASNGACSNDIDNKCVTDDGRFSVANYCTDRTIMEQRALHETLNRLLWRASVRAGELKNEWAGHGDFRDFSHYYIYRKMKCDDELHFGVGRVYYCKDMDVFFPTKKSAENAIETIIKPFMKEHPEFVW